MKVIEVFAVRSLSSPTLPLHADDFVAIELAVAEAELRTQLEHLVLVVAEEEVGPVDGTVQANVERLDSGLGVEHQVVGDFCYETVVAEVGETLNVGTENGREVLAELEAEVGVEWERVVERERCGNTNLCAKIPVVEELSFLQAGLCVSASKAQGHDS